MTICDELGYLKGQKNQLEAVVLVSADYIRMTSFEDDLVTLRKLHVPGTHAYVLSPVRSPFMSNRHVGNQLFVSGRGRLPFLNFVLVRDVRRIRVLNNSPLLLVLFVELHDIHMNINV